MANERCPCCGEADGCECVIELDHPVVCRAHPKKERGAGPIDMIKPGATFLHKSWLADGTQGRRYDPALKMECVITAVRQGSVYYKPLGWDRSHDYARTKQAFLDHVLGRWTNPI